MPLQLKDLHLASDLVEKLKPFEYKDLGREMLLEQLQTSPAEIKLRFIQDWKKRIRFLSREEELTKLIEFCQDQEGGIFSSIQRLVQVQYFIRALCEEEYYSYFCQLFCPAYSRTNKLQALDALDRAVGSKDAKEIEKAVSDNSKVLCDGDSQYIVKICLAKECFQSSIPLENRAELPVRP